MDLAQFLCGTGGGVALLVVGSALGGCAIDDPGTSAGEPVGFAEDQVLNETSSSGGLGLVQSDAVVGRNIVAGPTFFAAETSAAWSDMSSTAICAKASNGVVISWNDETSSGANVTAGWAQACLGAGWVAQTATTSNWGHINGKDGLPATGYGGDGSVISIPACPGCSPTPLS